jgi:hypothetical protein
MIESGWLFAGLVGVGSVVAAITTPIDEILAGLVGVAAWSLFGYGATNVEAVVDGATDPVTYSEPGLAIFGGLMAAVMAAVVFRGSVLIMAPGIGAADPEDRQRPGD